MPNNAHRNHPRPTHRIHRNAPWSCWVNDPCHLDTIVRDHVAMWQTVPRRRRRTCRRPNPRWWCRSPRRCQVTSLPWRSGVSRVDPAELLPVKVMTMLTTTTTTMPCTTTTTTTTTSAVVETRRPPCAWLCPVVTAPSSAVALALPLLCLPQLPPLTLLVLLSLLLPLLGTTTTSPHSEVRVVASVPGSPPVMRTLVMAKQHQRNVQAPRWRSTRLILERWLRVASSQWPLPLVRTPPLCFRQPTLQLPVQLPLPRRAVATHGLQRPLLSR